MAIDTILLAVGSGDAERTERLAEETLDLAGPTGATVVLGHVFTQEEYDESLRNLDFDRMADEVTPDDVAKRHSTVREVVTLLDHAGVDYEIRGAVGDQGGNIVGLAESVNADRVIVGGRRRSPTGKAVFGSTAQKVMLSSSCPVTFVRADAN